MAKDAYLLGMTSSEIKPSNPTETKPANPTETKPSNPENPKDICGSNKLPLHLWPSTATAMGCIALLNGALKYGRGNFRTIGVRATIYIDAAMRHITAWAEGEECDQEDGVPHLAAALACLAILVDAQAARSLNDDRNYPGGYLDAVKKLTPHVARLKAHHAGKSPKHYSVKDSAYIVRGDPVQLSLYFDEHKDE